MLLVFPPSARTCVTARADEAESLSYEQSSSALALHLSLGTVRVLELTTYSSQDVWVLYFRSVSVSRLIWCFDGGSSALLEF